MKLKSTIIFGFISLFFILLSHTLQAGQQAEETAIASAQKWLTLIDEGKYSESWNEAAGFFKTAVSKKDWLKSMEAFRKPLGALISRKLKSKKYTTSLPGAPDGEYVVVQYETSFEHKKSAIETVTPILDKNGKWLVSGYYIK
jgi:hypothetical protein